MLVTEDPPDSLIPRMPIGAEPTALGVRFRVWAPGLRQVSVVLEEGGEHQLEPQPGGYFTAVLPGIGPQALYRFRLNGGGVLFPDPASRYQPEGPHGPSEIIDPHAYRWTDHEWAGAALPGQVLYEMHVGTFTPQGTWAAAAEKLPVLKDIGVTCIEMMPVADFPGQFGWGYDGVNLFAPTRLYGRPDDLRAFIDRAHGLGLGVILDVVYNHFGPDGNYISAFTTDYFSDRYENEWGDPLNFDGENSAGVREFFLANARYWIEEFHFDGLRLDATQSLHDASEEHILQAIERECRAAAGTRSILLVAENEPQDTNLVRSRKKGGIGLDALWNDDFHHTAMVAATGHRRAYYADHAGSPQEFISAAKRGFLFQGQHYTWQGKRRGRPGLDVAPAHFVTFLQNHDQVANSGRGLRLHQRTSPGRARALTALLLLMPGTPMLFQGQEFWASSPFLFFCDHKKDLANAVRQGRRDFLSQFQNLARPEMAARLSDPCAPDTFASCRLDWSEMERHVQAVALHRDLLAIRRQHAAFNRQGVGSLDGAVLGPECFLLRFFASGRRDCVLIVNLGADIERGSIAEPLLAPEEDCRWQVLWSSEHPDYGGSGTPQIELAAGGWHIPAHAAVVLINQKSGPDGSSC